MSKRALYAGSFDPLTSGHLDIIERGSKMFNHLVVAVGCNPKKAGLFSVEERLEMLKLTCKHLKNVSFNFFDGLTADFARKEKCDVLVRGLRDSQDFSLELQMANMNRHISAEIETVFFPSLQQYSSVSSSLIKEVASLGGNISGLVPKIVEERLTQKLCGPK